MSDLREYRVYLWPMTIWQSIRKYFGFQKYKIVLRDSDPYTGEHHGGTTTRGHKHE